jgi:hypothetical protein
MVQISRFIALVSLPYTGRRVRTLFTVPFLKAAVLKAAVLKAAVLKTAVLKTMALVTITLVTASAALAESAVEDATIPATAGPLLSQPVPSQQMSSQPLFSEPLFSEPRFLSASEAFQLSATLHEDRIELTWFIEPGYYLYRHRLSFESSQQLAEPQMDHGLARQDEFFGDVEVFYQTLQVEIPLKEPLKNLEMTVGFQGCADAGLCYPPQKQHVKL